MSKLTSAKKKRWLGIFKRPDLSTRKANMGWVFVLPFVIGLLALYLPIVLDSVWFSFNSISYQLDTTTNVVSIVVTPEGFNYYREAIANTGYLESLLNGVGALALNVPAIVIFSLFIAVILNQKMAGRAAFRAIFFIPVILATGMMETIESLDILSDSLETEESVFASGEYSGFLGMFDATMMLSSMKVGGELVGYVLDLVTRVYELINDSGVQMLIFLAGLQSISPSIYEACQIEGATAWETFWKITIPMISPMILVNGIYTVIDSFTKGSNVVMKFIDTVYNAPNRHLATAMSWIYFLVVLLLVGLVALIMSAFVFYQKRD
ncbi:MAG: sugar ABC transporter permease [Clostridia bacterium]|nr:sugar ABC transporter permease [Clostridia bacterium]